MSMDTPHGDEEAAKSKSERVGGVLGWPLGAASTRGVAEGPAGRALRL